MKTGEFKQAPLPSGIRLTPAHRARLARLVRLEIEAEPSSSRKARRLRAFLAKLEAHTDTPTPAEQGSAGVPIRKRGPGGPQP